MLCGSQLTGHEDMQTTAVDTIRDAGAPAPSFQPDPAWWNSLFAVIDAGDAAGFAAFLTPDARFRFGKAETVVGADAIREAAAGFFAAIASSRHRLLHHWNGAATAVCEGEVAYTRHDGSVVTVPFANVFELRGDKIAAYRIYIDNSPLFDVSV